MCATCDKHFKEKNKAHVGIESGTGKRLLSVLSGQGKSL